MLLKEMRIHWATYAFLLVWNMYWLSLLNGCLRVQMISSAFFLKWPILSCPNTWAPNQTRVMNLTIWEEASFLIITMCLNCLPMSWCTLNDLFRITLIHFLYRISEAPPKYQIPDQWTMNFTILVTLFGY